MHRFIAWIPSHVLLIFLWSPAAVAAFSPGHALDLFDRCTVMGLAAWQLGLAIVLLGSLRRLILASLPLAALIPPYIFFCVSFGSVPGDALVAATWHGSWLQAWEMLRAFGWWWLGLWVAIVVAYGLAAWHWVLQSRLSVEARKRGLALLLLIAMVLLLMRQFLPQQLRWPGLFESETVSLVYPNNLLLSTQRVLAQQRRQSDSVSVGGRPKHGWETQPLVVVFVIGESVRPDHLSVYGYARATTPKLKTWADELLVFQDVASTAHFTHLAVRNLVAPPTKGGHLSLVKTFGEAGFATAWFSNQERSELSQDAQVSTHAESGYDFHLRPDSALLAPFESFLRQAGARQFIVMHMAGSHFPYEERYDTSSKRFAPTLADAGVQGHPGVNHKQEAINSYDNTLVALDAFLDRMHRALEQEARPVIWIYTSDHGENLFDDSRGRFMHALQTPSSWDTQVPLLVWTNSAYQRLNGTALASLAERRGQPVSHRDVFPTLLDLSGVHWVDEHEGDSLASPLWRPRTRRLDTLNGPGEDFDRMRHREQPGTDRPSGHRSG